MSAQIEELPFGDCRDAVWDVWISRLFVGSVWRRTPFGRPVRCSV